MNDDEKKQAEAEKLAESQIQSDIADLDEEERKKGEVSFNLNTEELLGKICDTSDEAEKYKVLHHLGGYLTTGDDETAFWVIFVRKKGYYNPVVVTGDRELISVHDNEVNLLMNGVDKKDIPASEKYHYFDFNDVRYRWPHKIGFDDADGINHISNQVLSDIVNRKLYTEDLYNNVVNLEKQYWFASDPFEYDVFTANVWQSYLKLLLGRVFYHLFNGSPNTGKSVGLFLMSLLQFNGLFGGRGTVASSVRLLHTHSISLCQDEFEKMGADERVMMTGVFNTGFNISGSYRITNTAMKDVLHQVFSFRTFGCKSATTNDVGPFDVSFLDRCHITIGRRTSQHTKDIYSLSLKDIREFNDYRDNLFVYTVLNWKAILNSIDHVRKGLEKEGIFGRETDKNSIILGLVRHFRGTDYMMKLKKYLEERAPVQQIEHARSMEQVILETIVDRLPRLPVNSVDVENETLYDALLKWFGGLASDKYAPSDQKPRKILDNLRLTSRRENLGYTSEGKRLFHINTKELEQCLREHGFDEILKKVSWWSLLSPAKPPKPLSKNTEETEGSEETKGLTYRQSSGHGGDKTHD
jgi:hypothetical protein